jgi:hypothetical protein
MDDSGRVGKMLSQAHERRLTEADLTGETVTVAAITVHFDDSGTHVQAPIAVIGGWVAPIGQWKRFTRTWKKALDELKMTECHMAHLAFNNKDSEFADKSFWTDHRKTIAMRRLSWIISQHAIQGFCIGVIKKDYDEIFPEEAKAATGKFHYTYALRGAIGFMEQWRIDKGVSEPIEYIFDHMVKGPERAEIDRVFEEATLLGAC